MEDEQVERERGGCDRDDRHGREQRQPDGLGHGQAAEDAERVAAEVAAELIRVGEVDEPHGDAHRRNDERRGGDRAYVEHE